MTMDTLENDVMALQVVRMKHVDYDKQIAVIRKKNAAVNTAVNLWEIAGRYRRKDGFSAWRYRVLGESNPFTEDVRVGDRVRVTKSLLYTGREGVVQPNSGDPEDFWDFNVILDATADEESRRIGLDAYAVERI